MTPASPVGEVPSDCEAERVAPPMHKSIKTRHKFRKNFPKGRDKMKAYRIHEKNGYMFEDTEPRKACVYDIVNVKLPQGAQIFDFGGAEDVLKRIRIKDNSYTHLDTYDNEPVLVHEAIKNGISISTNDWVTLKYDVVEETLRCDFECLASRQTPDNVLHVNYANGKYWLTDLYGRKIISKQEAMRYQAAWK